MTQQPFSRPGAIDLSALKKPAPSAPSTGGGGSAGGAGGASGTGATGSYFVSLDEQNFLSTLEA
jgi:putative thioredoxin